ncbi:hypothetical protein [Chitinophaga sancti]|uniref:Uncharacterized protein n=1 Tax=Chitinophaga sancti TaxID=1004 RepID=A0A1K1RQM1_9BACT|nr:hypothetical protein [Chitinophaga sancti]WQD62533.1 hypothetical protein U0033_32075 [Chitinophaga sancti]WQG91898.1 hypothetical protein SR876_10310 [Chitinophaga sancti]SFW74092.1 hypothetical protein SAMN05661012_04099 [Chitinophaga sancti]
MKTNKSIILRSWSWLKEDVGACIPWSGKPVNSSNKFLYYIYTNNTYGSH